MAPAAATAADAPGLAVAPWIDALAHGRHHALAVGAGFERMVFQQAGAAHLATRLADNVAQLMSEQRLPAHGNQVELAGRKGDVAALRQRVRTRIRDRRLSYSLTPDRSAPKALSI